MPSEKAKENKALVAACTACEKTVSVEMMQGLVVRRNGRRISVPVCEKCIAAGWVPPPPAS